MLDLTKYLIPSLESISDIIYYDKMNGRVSISIEMFNRKYPITAELVNYSKNPPSKQLNAFNDFLRNSQKYAKLAEQLISRSKVPNKNIRYYPTFVRVSPDGEVALICENQDYDPDTISGFIKNNDVDGIVVILKPKQDVMFETTYFI